MNSPFIRIIQNKPHIVLNKSLYEKKLIDIAIKEEPDFIASIKAKGDYYLLELKDNNPEDNLHFLDFMVYLRRTNGE